MFEISKSYLIRLLIFLLQTIVNNKKKNLCILIHPDFVQWFGVGINCALIHSFDPQIYLSLIKAKE